MLTTLTLEQTSQGVATVWLNRPEKHNAMSGAMITELHQVAQQLDAAEDARCVVLAAKGPSFCAGADLGWMRAQLDADQATRKSEAAKLAYMLKAWGELSKPVIGRLQGNAFGGGLGLASVCDVTIGVAGLRMALTETRLGLIPATIGPYVAARMGPSNARQVFYSGRRFDATEAQSLGLLSKVVSPEDLEDAVAAEVAPYLECAPGAVRRAKQLLRQLSPQIDEAVIAQTIDALAACWQEGEAAEGISAFFAKTKPSWQR
ncbi:MAG: crotonase/enoyl-CoA hydratase family protein [Thalassovita sp.]